jgi:flagellar motor switch protein FliN/FliY
MPSTEHETMDKRELIAGTMDAFTSALSEALSETGPENFRLDWSLTPDTRGDADTWTWWSAGLSTYPGANFFMGAPEETWETLARASGSEETRENAFALIGRGFAKAIEDQFGDRAATQDSGPSGAPSQDWTRISIAIHLPDGEWPNACCILSPEFEQALRAMNSAVAPAIPATTGRMNPSDMLMHVQVPVSVSFGATQIRMKELLNLSAGSVVELDQALHDNVEVRVNDRVIARGEVVAVDGHYGVRVLELVSSGSKEGI